MDRALSFNDSSKNPSNFSTNNTNSSRSLSSSSFATVTNSITTKCPICDATVTSLPKHFSKNNICASLSQDHTILSVNKQICSLTPQKLSARPINHQSQTNQVVRNTDLYHLSTNDVDEDLMYVPYESETIYEKHSSHGKNSTVSSKNHLLTSFHSNYDVTSVDEINSFQSRSKKSDYSSINRSVLQGQIHNLQTSLSDDLEVNPDISDSIENTIVDFHTQHKDFKEDNVQVLLFKDSSPDSTNHILYSTNPTSSFVAGNNDNDLQTPPHESNTTTKSSNIVDKSIDNFHGDQPLSSSSYGRDRDYIPLKILDDFTEIQKKISNSNNNLVLTHQEVAAVRLLKLMIDGNIAASRYSDIVNWYSETFLSFMDVSNNFVSTSCDIPSKKQSVVKLCFQKIFHGSRKYTIRPIHSILQLPSKTFSRISSFDFNSMVLSMLTDTELTQPSNMLIEEPQYLDPKTILSIDPDHRYYGDIHTGSWFLAAHSKLCHQPTDILCPIILFIDGTPIDSYGNLKLESVMFTLGIFNRETRNKSGAWRLLGYIPDLTQDTITDRNFEVDEVQDTEIVSEQVQKRRDYHHALKHIIQGIIDAENSDGILWDYVDSRNNIHKYCLKFSLMFVIGDALGNDKLCDRFMSYSSKTKYLCRDCDIPTSKIEDIGYQCQFIERKNLLNMSESELKKRSYYKVCNNAFDYCKFGYDKYGINGCTPIEYLHQFQLGVLKKIVDVFFNSITSSGLKVLDEVTKYIAINWHRQSNKDYPDLQPFKDGLQKKKLSGDEVVAQVFIIYLSMSQTYTLKAFYDAESKSSLRYKTKKVVERNTPSTGSSSLRVVKEKKFYSKIGSSMKNIKLWIKVFEASLAFYAWMKQPEIPFNDLKLVESTGQPNTSSKTSRADTAIKSFLKLYMDVVIKPAGDNAAFRMKDHQTNHIAHQSRRFGSPLNFDGGIGERHLKSITKNPARSTQQRSFLLSQQATERYAERVSINRLHSVLVTNGLLSTLKSATPYVAERKTKANATNVMNNDGGLDSSDYYSTSGPYKYLFDDEGKLCGTSWDIRKNRKITHNEVLLSEVFKRLKMQDFQLDCNYIDCFTVLKVCTGGKDTSFRADPYFFQKIWFDWCMTKWEIDDDDSSDSGRPTNDSSEGLYPARILMFIDPSKMKFKKTLLVSKGRYWAVVRCTKNDLRRPKNPPRYGPDSNLFCTFEREDSIRIISCQNISRDAFVCSDLDSIETNHNTIKSQFKASHIMYVTPIEKWAGIFINTKWG